MRNKGVFWISPVNNVVNSKAFDNEMDVEEALDVSGHGVYNYLVLVTSCTIHLGVVLDMLGFSLVIPAASCDLQLSLKESGALISISFAGFMFAVPWGYFADTSGRRRAMLVSAALGFVFTTLCSIATNFTAMLILKFLGCSLDIASLFILYRIYHGEFSGESFGLIPAAGFAIVQNGKPLNTTSITLEFGNPPHSTASLSLTGTYLGECTPRKLRTKFIFIQNCYSLAADLACYVLAFIVLPMEFKIPVLWFVFRPWRLLIILMALPLGIGALMLTFLPESPKFLANVGDTDKAVMVLETFYKVNTGGGNYPVKLIKSTKKDDEPSSFWESLVSQTVPIFRTPLLWRTLQLFYLWSILCATNNVFFIWFPTLVNSFYNNSPDGVTESFCQRIIANISSTDGDNTETCNDKTQMNTIYVGIFFSLSFTILNLLIIKLSPWRKTLLIIILTISGTSSIVVNFVQGSIGSVVFFSMIQFTGLCVGVISSYFVDLYPTSYRGLASSVGMMVARFSCLGGVNLIGAVIVDYCDITFYSWAVYVLSGVFIAMLLPSEQKIKEGKC